MKPKLYTFPNWNESSAVFDFEDLVEDGLYVHAAIPAGSYSVRCRQIGDGARRARVVHLRRA